MNKYQNGKIYKLTCDNSPLIYYGSTCQKLDYRLLSHRNGSSNCTSKELFQLGNVSIHLIEEYPCNSKKELESRERIYIEFMLKNFDYKIICNRKIPNRTKFEHYHQNKQFFKEKRAIPENKEKRKKYTQIKITCECGSFISKCELARHKKSKKHIAYVANQK